MANANDAPEIMQGAKSDKMDRWFVDCELGLWSIIALQIRTADGYTTGSPVGESRNMSCQSYNLLPYSQQVKI